MKKEKIVLTPLQKVIKNLQDSSFFRYGSAVTFDYDTYHPCQDGSDCCDNDYCRCGIIQNTRITEVNFVLLIKDLVGKCDDILIKYCVDRIIKTSGLINNDSWEVNTSGGYYGEEVHGVSLNIGIQNKLVKMFSELDTANDINKIKILLQYEYGYLLPKLDKLNTVTIKEVPINKVSLLNDKHYRKVSKETIDYYTDYVLPRAICTKSVYNNYTVIDGYHRMISAINKKEATVSIFELSK
jgi:hypothetical protein